MFVLNKSIQLMSCVVTSIHNSTFFMYSVDFKLNFFIFYPIIIIRIYTKIDFISSNTMRSTEWESAFIFLYTN